MKRFIMDEETRKGSYRRGDLRGDVLGALYSYAEISGIMVPGHVACRDNRVIRMQRQGLIDAKALEAYSARLNETMAGQANREDATFEQLYALGCRLRLEIFGRELMDAADRRDAGESRAEPAQWDIDQREIGYRLLDRCRCALFAVSDLRECARARLDMERARSLGKAVYAAYAGDGSALLPGRGLVSGLFPDDCLAALSDAGEVDADEALTSTIESGEAVLFWYGETGLTHCRCMKIQTMVCCIPESLTGKALTGQFTGEAAPCAVYVPAGFDILPFVPLVRRTLACYRHFAWLCAAHGEDVYAMGIQQLYERWPETFFSIYEESSGELPEGITWPKGDAGTESWYADFCRRRDDSIEAMLNGMPGLRGFSRWFELDTLAQKSVPWDARGEAKGILVHGVVAEQAEGALVRLAAGEPISPRVMLNKQENPPALQLISNYLFFFTPRLAGLYNRLRADRPREQSAMAGGHLDYMLFRDENGRRVETFPLYRKACMGMTEDGRFVFFHFRLRGGSLSINGQTVNWLEEDVDPEKPGQIAVYTPYLSRADEGADRLTYSRTVGGGRVNFVVNQTELTCARDGDVLLPGTGVVISLEREKGLALAAACGFEPAEDGYYVCRNAPDIRTCLQNPEEIAPETWRGMQWAYGGGLTLMQGGESFFKRGEDAAGKLAEEGWASPLSAQTQESDIAALARHPRTAIGLTRSGALFILVFSGRSSVSAGADYVEMCEIARKLVPDAREMMNVDGGGSAVLGLAIGRRFVEYSWPSSSFDSLPGMVRPVNSLFCVTVKS